MKAIEFVKKFGIDHAKRAVFREEAPYAKAVCVYNGRLTFSVSMGGPEWVLIADLKQIIDAWELVESKGGLAECKKILSRDNFTWCSGGRVYVNPLERAVKIVEQCQ